MSANITQQALAELVSGELSQGDPTALITGVNSLSEAEPGDVSFIGNSRYLSALKTTRASAVLLSPELTEPVPTHLALIRVSNPTLAFSHAIRHFSPAPRTAAPGVHPSAVIGQNVQFDPDKVSIGPCAVIEDDVILGAGTSIGAGCFIGHGSRIGTDCLLHPNVTVRERCKLGNRVIIHSSTVIGSDGFGYEFSQGHHVKVEQVGIVQVDDDVEIGSGTTIDRARFGRTWIGAGTKIDNLVQIAHNVVLGKHCVVVAQVGISGSTRIGNYVTIAGQAGIAGHLEITDQVIIMGRAGVTKNLTQSGAYMGYPTHPVLEGRRIQALTHRLPEIMDRLRQLENQLKNLNSTQPS
jgi:UDP-3-O-[3-hydroxymyristoyl] glucosamine N-acyltransferase